VVFENVVVVVEVKNVVVTVTWAKVCLYIEVVVVGGC